MNFEPYIVYIKVNERNIVEEINSSAFIADITGWEAIDQGYGDKYHHAQNNYFEKPICDERGIGRYKKENGVVIERTQEEMDAEWIEPEKEPTLEEKLDALMGAIETGLAL